MWNLKLRLRRPKTGSAMWISVSVKTGHPSADVIKAAKRVMTREYPDWIVIDVKKQLEGA